MHTRPRNHNKRSFPRRVACSPVQIRVCGPGSCFSSPPQLLGCRSVAEMNPPLPEKPNKTMESVRHSKANGFTAASSPPSLFMCKSIHRALMAPAMHDTDSFKWPGEKNKKSLTHLQSWQKTIQQRRIESAFFISRWCKCLFTGLMRPLTAVV